MGKSGGFVATTEVSLRNYRFKSLLRKRGIKHETSAPYSPHQNGTVERTWRTLFNMARCQLLEAKLPKNSWTYAVMTSVFLRNRCFNQRLGKTPYEALVGKQPNLSNMCSDQRAMRSFKTLKC